MDEYISRQDVLEIAKHIGGEKCAIFVEISRLPIYNTAEQFKIIIENLEQLSFKMDKLETQFIQIRQEYKAHTYRTESASISTPWWWKPGDKGGYSGCGGG